MTTKLSKKTVSGSVKTGVKKPKQDPGKKAAEKVEKAKAKMIVVEIEVKKLEAALKTARTELDRHTACLYRAQLALLDLSVAADGV